jgi:hypothetical protein
VATKPTTIKAPASKPRKYTKAEIDAINKGAESKIEKVNQDSNAKLKRKVERAQWDKKYKRGLV